MKKQIRHRLMSYLYSVVTGVLRKVGPTGVEAYERSNMSPSKEKLLACASRCFMDKNKDEGRRAIVEANKASE